MSISSKVLRDERQRQKKAKQNTKWWKCTNKWNKSSSTPSCALSLLPDDILLNCLASVSKSDHASLSLVNKWLRSLTLSPDLYHVRSLTGCTENCIFLCLSIPSDPFVRWFAFYPKNLNSPGRLVAIRPHLYQPEEGSSVVAHGSGIYIIGGMIGGKRSSRFFFLDGRFHTWSNLPCMGEDRAFAVAGVVDGKIYVFGGCEDPNSDKWGEVFDIEKQTWDVLPKRTKETYSPVMHESFVWKDKYVFSLNEKGDGLLYNPSEGVWRKGKSDAYRPRKGWHVINNVIYCCETGGKILWCQASTSKVMKWKQVMGLEGLKDTLCASKLVNYGWGLPEEKLDDLLPGHKLSNSGPNMLLFWDVLAPKKLEIWCAEISLRWCKAKGEIEIWGKVEWSEVVMTLDPPCPLLQHQHHCKILHSVTLNL
ncbi:unnamed protein product [Eruca vesicaria subsp. sativa]|uniref:F-box domain-containing protein n=1 Tax=Eruca vesicaria subsp. sativa TaxID=29727 RepID=A0ABC8LGL2_ERUVS|nr:unnamed protein product [Eruca vesicaria subsp. sativa]